MSDSMSKAERNRPLPLAQLEESKEYQAAIAEIGKTGVVVDKSTWFGRQELNKIMIAPTEDNFRLGKEGIAERQFFSVDLITKEKDNIPSSVMFSRFSQTADGKQRMVNIKSGRRVIPKYLGSVFSAEKMSKSIDT